MSAFGSSRERLVSILNAAFAEGLFSEQTHSYRLGLVFGPHLIDQQELIGDLTLRSRRSRATRQVRDAWRALVEQAGALIDRAAPFSAPLLLALDPDNGERLLVGRDARCDVVVKNPTVSRRHALLTFRDGLWLIRDLDSKNGTFVNGAVVGRLSLRPGDIVALGGQLIQID